MLIVPLPLQKNVKIISSRDIVLKRLTIQIMFGKEHVTILSVLVMVRF